MKIINYLSFFFCLTMFTNCVDNCDGIECGNGSCDAGTCICPEGFEGNLCATLSNQKYYGKYNVTNSNCEGGGQNEVQTMTISTVSAAQPTKVKVKLASSSITGEIDGSIKDDKLTASGDFGGINTSISGTFTNENLLIAEVNGSITCEITFTR